ncbi:MAG: N-acetylmuramoyl-L-alanine amidase [Thermoanaerobaculia bacterium]
MASVTRVKQRLLREAVEENVFLVQGKRPPRRSGRPRVYRGLRAAFFVVAPLALFSLTYVVGRAAAEKTGAGASGLGRPILLSREPLPSPVVETPQAVVLASAPSFAAPEPIGREVFPLAVRRVVLDPGHGGENRGTASRDGLMEKELTLDIAERLRALLEGAAFEVEMTRTDDATLSLARRGELANRAEGDIFVSIHVNWLEDTDARGVETFYLGPTDDPYLERLAASENGDGSLRLAELREALERVYAGVRREESRALAEAVQRSLLVSLRTLDPGVRNRGVKTAPFGVLIRTQMPAILAEVGALSSEVDSELFRDPSYRQYLAEALFEGIQAYSRNLSDNSA